MKRTLTAACTLCLTAVGMLHAQATVKKRHDCSAGCFEALITGDINVKFSGGAIATTDASSFSISLVTGNRGIIVGRTEGGPIAPGRYVLPDADGCHDDPPDVADDAITVNYTAMDNEAVGAHSGVLVISRVTADHVFGSIEFEGCDVYHRTKRARIKASFDAWLGRQ